MLPFLSLALGWHALLLIVFGTLGLMLFPQKAVVSKWFRGATFSEQHLAIYRICGLWVASMGFVSAFALSGEQPQRQRLWCLFFALIHGVECLLKVRARGWKLPVLAANGHLFALLLLAAMLG